MMNRKEIKRFAKFLSYVLGMRPDEFGLVPDPEGFVHVKELLQALREEEEWPFVRRVHLVELLHSPERDIFEWVDDRIRSKTPATNLLPEPTHSPPPRLFHGVRPRAHPVVLLRGVRPNKGPWVILSQSREMALRIGKRRSPDPVILEIQAEEAARKGVRFYETQGLLTLTEFIPHEFITGPPASPERDSRPSSTTRPKEPRDLPGSFFLDHERIFQKDRTKGQKRRESSWRQEKQKRTRKSGDRRRH